MKNSILLIGSLLFYSFGEPVYILLMLFSIFSDFALGLKIEKEGNQKRRKGWLLLSVAVNLSLLCFFKYSGLNLPLPVGISFYTFQTMSYTIDVYRKEVKAQKNLLDFAVFITMFPQLIAGPIVKYREVEQELHHRKTDWNMISEGSWRFITGLGKKVLLANNIGILFTEILETSDLASMSMAKAWLGMTAFAFQIYFDFSGYSDMAIGLGKIMGFQFPENFDYPYLSKSITEFWRRWHISLSSWFREYVYIPLGGNRAGTARQLLNLFIVWTLTGIWHGAGLNFLCWGIWFAVLLILEKTCLLKIIKKLPSFLQWLYTWILVLFGWCFFSLEEKEQILPYLQAMLGYGNHPVVDSSFFYLLSNYGILLVILGIFATTLPGKVGKALSELIKKQKGGLLIESLIKTGWGISLLVLSVAGIVDASYNPFLYFRF